MADILSQSEIDSLLASLSSGEMSATELKESEAEKKIKTYDFKRALRFSKDQLRGLNRIHDNFARMLTTYFSAQLRTFVKIEVASVEQLPYEEFIRSIPMTTILNVFEAAPLDGRMVMETNPNVIFSMIDRLMGGVGVEGNEVTRSLTEIETTVIERMLKRSLDYFRDAWKGIADIRPQHIMIETNPQFMQIVSPNETVAVISLDTEIGDTTGMINLCLPHVVLEDVLPKLTAHHWLSSKKKKQLGAQEETFIKRRIERALIPLNVELGRTRIKMRDLVNLSPGDVLPLDQKADELLVIRLGKRAKFLGQPGTVGKKLAVQIHEVLPREDEDDG